MQRISFAVADNPFIKADVEKFYPEIHVISGKGELLTTISPSNKACDKFGNSMFCSDFRDDKLKINDDRKVKLTLSDFYDKDTMILLTVRSNDMTGEKFDPAVYKDAWFRLQNEDTNQSIDYTYIKKVELPEGFEEDAEAAAAGDEEAEDGDEAGKKQKNEVIWLAGRIYREDVVIKSKPSTALDESADEPKSPGEEVDVKWIYERYNKAITTEQFPSIASTLADLHCRSREEIDTFKARVKDAKQDVSAAAEKRKADLAAAQKKAKAGKGKKKKGEDVPDEEDAVP